MHGYYKTLLVKIKSQNRESQLNIDLFFHAEFQKLDSQDL